MGGRHGHKAVRGEIGEQTFAEVEALTSGGNMKRLAAFKEVAKRTGKNVGTISANYYRVARKRNVPLRPRRGRAAGRPGVQAAVAAVTAAMRKLEATLRAQQEELARLRNENGRLAKLRRLLAS